MELSALVTKDLEITEPDATVTAAAKRMEVGNVGMLPVVEEKKVVGLLTDRDIVVRVVARERNPALTRVKDIMTTAIVTCPLESGVEEAARRMKEHRVRRLIVTDASGEFVGVVSMGDLAKADQTRLAGDVLHDVAAH